MATSVHFADLCSSPGDGPEPSELDLDVTHSIILEISGTSFDKYPAKQHALRVAGQLQGSSGLIYLMGQRTALLEDSDQSRPFRQRRYFYYLSGVDEPDCHLTYDIKTDKLTLYVPDFDFKRAIWMGPTLGLKEAEQRYDIDVAKYHRCLAGDIERWARDYNCTSPIYILHDHQSPVTSGSGRWFDHETLLPAMDFCRVIKDEHEIGLIRRANKVSALAHSAVLQNIQEMENEAEIQATFLDISISNGAKSQAYEIIAASGENAATLHYIKNNEPLKGRQLVCLDAGCEWNCYASDVTRTFPRSGEWPSKEARDIYYLVQKMQEECVSRIKEGVRFLDLHELAHTIAVEGLLKLGIFKGGSVDEIRRSGASLVFFPHGLGHHVGLEVHDVPPESIMAVDHGDDEQYTLDLSIGLPPCTPSAPTLKAGMVITVEPGIYFSRLALDYVRLEDRSRFIDMSVVFPYMAVGGVRIEDDILVTKNGYENLTVASKGEEMLKIIRRGTRSCTSWG